MKFLPNAMRTPKRKLAVAAAAVMIAGTGAAVAAEVGGADHSSEYNPASPPCRLVDTRTGLGGKTGKFTNGETHTYTVTVGTNPDCASNTQTQGYDVSVTAVQPSNAGYVRVWGPSDVTEPQATFLNYPSASPGGFGASGPVKIGGASIGEVGDFKVKNYGGPTHIVIDVFASFGTP